MQGVHRNVLLLLFFSIGLVQSCATPIAPTGGPVDSEPPLLLRSIPENESVLFSGDSFEIEFSEHLNLASFAQALSLTPDLEDGPEIKWNGRKVEIEFGDQLRDSTTYIITIDKSLKDIHNVALSRPIILAFSTGSMIDSGRLAGEIRDPRTGESSKDMDVLAFGFNEDGSLSERALYRTQVADNGNFSFSYLPNRPFRVIGLVDRNRNQQLDEGERSAHAAESSYLAKSDSVHIPKLVLWEGGEDAEPPVLSRVRAEDAQVFRLEFSESLSFNPRDFENWSLRDSLSGEETLIIDASMSRHQKSQLLLFTRDSLSSTHLLDLVGIRDSLGNAMDTLGVVVRPRARVRDKPVFTGLSVLGPALRRDSIQVLYSSSKIALDYDSWLDPMRIEASLDSLKIEPALWKRSGDGRIVLEGRNESLARPSRLEVLGLPFGVDTTFTAYYEFLRTSEMGSISGHLSGSSSTIAEFYCEAWGKDALDVVILSGGDFNTSDLPKGSYAARFIEDLDGNERWTSGSLDPFRAPERIQFYSDTLLVQSRFETVLDTLRWD